MREKYKKLIQKLKDYRRIDHDYYNKEYSSIVNETQDAAKALEEIIGAYADLKKKYNSLEYKYDELCYDQLLSNAHE